MVPIYPCGEWIASEMRPMPWLLYHHPIFLLGQSAPSMFAHGAAFNVTANLIAPGVIGTESYFAVPEKMRERIERAHAMGRHGEPEDIAHAAAYFASEDAKFTTGQVLVVGGGVDLFVF